MSTANVVPETFELTGDDARRTLARARITRLAKDSAIRFRWADGFSHSRALAFQTVLTLIPAVVVAVGFSTLIHQPAVSATINRVIESLVPGSAADVFRVAANQGSSNAAVYSGRRALAVGAVVMLFSAATTFAQIERGANRIYGVEKDRPSVRKYCVATLMAVTSGAVLATGFVLIALGRGLNDSIGWNAGAAVVAVGRWPVGAALLIAGCAMIFRFSPRRRQPSTSWLAFGAAVSVLVTLLVSIGLAFYLNYSSSFGETYGPLAGFMGVMLWSYLNAIGLFLGLAFAAQLEAFRAGESAPQSEEKVQASEPELAGSGSR